MIQGQTVKLQGFKGVLSGKHVPGIWWAAPKQMLFSLAPSIPSAAGCLRLKKRGDWCFFRACFFFCVCVFLFEIGIPIQESVELYIITWIFRGISRVRNK